MEELLRADSMPADLKMQGMPSFSRMILPSFESATPSVFPSAFFFRNFLRSAWMASAQSRLLPLFVTVS